MLGVCVSRVLRRYTSEVTGQQEEKTGCKINAAGIGMLMVFKATETEVIICHEQDTCLGLCPEEPQCFRIPSPV